MTAHSQASGAGPGGSGLLPPSAPPAQGPSPQRGRFGGGAQLRHLWRSIDALPQMLALVDGSGRLLHMNPALAGWLEGAVPSEALLATLLSAERAEGASGWREALQQRQSFSCLTRLASGRWWRVTALPAGEGGCHVLQLTDVHELKVRALELEAAHARKDDIVAVLAHELLNSLQPLLHGAALLRAALGTVPPADPAAPLELMERQLERLRRLTGDLMDVSRLQRDCLDLKVEVADLGELARQAADSVRAQAQAGAHALELALPEEALRARVDPLRLVQVLVNLLINACKYSPRGAPIALRLERCGSGARLAVADAGVGIAMEELEHIFDRYVRLDATVASEGLGVGLWLSRELIVRQGGRLEASSEGPGRGSEFRVVLPLIGADAGPGP